MLLDYIIKGHDVLHAFNLINLVYLASLYPPVIPHSFLQHTTFFLLFLQLINQSLYVKLLLSID